MKVKSNYVRSLVVGLLATIMLLAGFLIMFDVNVNKVKAEESVVSADEKFIPGAIGTVYKLSTNYPNVTYDAVLKGNGQMYRYYCYADTLPGYKLISAEKIISNEYVGFDFSHLPDFIVINNHPLYTVNIVDCVKIIVEPIEIEKKEITLKSNIGNDIKLNVELITYRQALLNYLEVNTTYYNYIFKATKFDKAVAEDYVAKQIEKYSSYSWYKVDYYFYYILDTYCYDVPLDQQDLSHLTYAFHPKDTLKHFYPDFNDSMLYTGNSVDGLTKLNVDEFGYDNIYKITDFTKPIVFNIEDIIPLNIINVGEGLTYKTAFNNLKVTDGKVRVVINLNEPAALRKEFFGKINPYNLIGFLDYNIKVDGCDSFIIQDKNLIMYMTVDPKAIEYTLKVEFTKKIDDVVDDVGDTIDKIVDTGKDFISKTNDFIASVTNFFNNLFGGNWINIVIIIAIIIGVLLLISLIIKIFKG